MAKKITNEDILEINRAYQRIGTYSGVSRELGFSAGTVKKYIIEDFIDPDTLEEKKFSSTILPIDEIDIRWTLQLSEEEQGEIEELWKEIAI